MPAAGPWFQAAAAASQAVLARPPDAARNGPALAMIAAR